MKKQVLVVCILFSYASYSASAVLTIQNKLQQLITVTLRGKDGWSKRLSLSDFEEKVIDSGSDTPLYEIEWSYTILEKKNGHEIMHRYTWHIKVELSSSLNNILSKNMIQILPDGKYHLKQLNHATLVDHQVIDLGKPFNSNKVSKKIQGIIDEQDKNN